MAAISHTLNYNFTKGRPIVPRIADANLDLLDTILARIEASPYVLKGTDGEQTVGQRIQTLEVGPGLVLRDKGDGCFVIELS